MLPPHFPDKISLVNRFLTTIVQAARGVGQVALFEAGKVKVLSQDIPDCDMKLPINQQTIV